MSFEYHIPKCQHIRTNGTHCKSPALKADTLCYHHARDRQRVKNFMQARGYKSSDYMLGFTKLQESLNPEILESLEIPALDELTSIQVALTNTVRAIFFDHITDRKAGLALYGLQIAAFNLHKAQLAAAAECNDAEEPVLEDPKPIRDFGTDVEYYKHLARRGIRMLKEQDMNTNVSKLELQQDREKLDRKLKSGAM
jgi:hypothetical protein